jgi:3-deoxy-manno-octulosonate cytidylyltransferase (CMP-KDO synthetase)
MLEFAVPPETFPDRIGKMSQGPRVVAVIPARYQSSRLPGKPLADIAGHPMVEHVYRRAAEARGIDSVLVATDDERIARAVEQFGGKVRMTRADHRTGTDRIAEAVSDLACDVVVNVQGDLPLLEPAMLTELVDPLRTDPTTVMSTLCTQASPEEYDNPNVVKVVLDRAGNALYFSRSPLPYLRSGPPQGGPYKHIGLYGYRRDFLFTFAALPQTPLEQAESLEQLRALEHGYRIRTVITRHTTIEVDTPDDLERVRHEPITR